ncbi:phage/plasmid primase, P4 family, C-terminal domain protein [Pediococcus claussenii ATCC BAA-344]|uniref:Phage/plasmid primase, P4 family, C-terminal domain protein n=2 Tax=Pediococcus claussenii TaxID=187452 RepID=G8PCA3_PEDCP|nr:phage/plasmid primase, P4 family, C-terminal domain protein [Pediococcus claussenii ATCC BAA-344]
MKDLTNSLTVAPDDFRQLSFDEHAEKGANTSAEWEAIGRSYVEYLNNSSPEWLIFKLSSPSKRSQDIKHIILYDKLGDEIIQENMIQRYSALPEGAYYQKEYGTWKTFHRNELQALVKNEVIKKLKEVGVSWSYNDSRSTTEYVIGATYQPNIRGNPFESANPELVAFKNGTYNINSGKLQDNSPDNMLVNAHDYELNISGKPTPATNKLLEGMITEPAVNLFKQFVGYMFYHSHAPMQDAIFLHGNGGEGKSTLLNYISKEVLGIDNVSAVKPQDLTGENRFKLIQLYLKEANIVPDIKKGYLQNTDVLKTLTGGDTMDAEEKGVQGINFTSYAKLLFSANDLPTFSDNSTGFKDRLMVIDLVNGDTRKPDNHFWDSQDMDKVREERSSFVFDCLTRFKEALDKHRFDKPRSVIEATEAWHKDNDHFGEFLDEWCEIDLTSGKGEKASYVVSAYKEFCQMNNYSDKTTAQTITSNLAKLGVKKDKSTKGWNNSDYQAWRFIGLRLLKENYP